MESSDRLKASWPAAFLGAGQGGRALADAGVGDSLLASAQGVGESGEKRVDGLTVVARLPVSGRAEGDSADLSRDGGRSSAQKARPDALQEGVDFVAVVSRLQA
nr:hypothetical protein [Streptomyces lavendulae]